MNFLKKLFGSASAKLLDAAKNGPLEEVKRLLASGADKEATDEGGLTALHLAAVNGHADVVECLLAAEADMEAKGKGLTALHWAAFSGHADVVECLLAADADKDAKGKGGWTALHWAATKGHANVVQCLLAAGVDKEARDDGGRTALRSAVSDGHADVVECLLAAGADKEAKDKNGMTALHWAAFSGHAAVARCLLAAGADSEAKDENGGTALRWAEDDANVPPSWAEGRAAVVKCLTAASAAKEEEKERWGSKNVQCDICTRSGLGTIVPAKQFSDAVVKGFNPFYNGCIPEAMARIADAGYPKRWTESAISGDTSHSDWNVCTDCMHKLSGYLNTGSASSRAHSSGEDSPTGGIKILKKGNDGGLRESTGSFEDVAPLFQMAHSKYQSVMAAARSNSLTASHERELLEAVELLTKVIELHGTRGEPYGLRGGLYMVYGQINRDRDYLDKAERDYSKALDVGGSDPSNHATWRNSISQIGMIRGMI